MSTSAMIKVLSDGAVYPVMIYMHSDGYPDGPHGVMAWLCPFARRFSAHVGDDLEYCVAQILRYQAVTEYLRESSMDPDYEGAMSLSLQGWGLGTESYETSYTYEVTPRSGSVVCFDSNGVELTEQGPGEVWQER